MTVYFTEKEKHIFKLYAAKLEPFQKQFLIKVNEFEKNPTSPEDLHKIFDDYWNNIDHLSIARQHYKFFIRCCEKKGFDMGLEKAHLAKEESWFRKNKNNALVSQLAAGTKLKIL